MPVRSRIGLPLLPSSRCRQGEGQAQALLELVGPPLPTGCLGDALAMLAELIRVGQGAVHGLKELLARLGDMDRRPVPLSPAVAVETVGRSAARYSKMRAAAGGEPSVGPQGINPTSSSR